MSDASSDKVPGPRPLHEDVLVQLTAHLSLRPWFDITHKPYGDPEAVQCLATGYEGKKNGETVWFLNRYEDDGATYALVCHTRGNSGRVDLEPYQLQWLWEQATAAKETGL